VSERRRNEIKRKTEKKRGRESSGSKKRLH
jgi:hypothetical protein